jgi:hypothetical protein
MLMRYNIILILNKVITMRRMNFKIWRDNWKVIRQSGNEWK